MTSSSARAWLPLLVLFAVVPVAAQTPAVLEAKEVEVYVNVEPPAVADFWLNGAVNCSRESYTFRLTPDRDFVSLPDLPTDRRIELPSRGARKVSVQYDWSGLSPGTYTAKITIECLNCRLRQCSVRKKYVQLTMIVNEPPIAEPPDDELPVVEPSGDDPPIVEPPVAEPTDDEPPIVEPTGDELPVVQPPGDELPVVQPPGDEPTVVEPPGDELPVVQPPGDEPTVVEPPGDGPSDDELLSDKPPIENGLKGVWLPIVVLLAILGFSILYWRHSRPGASPAAKFDVRSHVDRGTQRVLPDISDRERPVMRVRLHNAAGEQSVHGDPAATTKKEE